MSYKGIRLKQWVIALFVLVFAFSCDDSDHLRVDQDFVHLNEDYKIVKADRYNLSAEEKENISEISEKLAVRYVNRERPEETAIDTAIISYFANGLTHLYNSNLSEAVTVTKEYTLIAGNPASPREVLLWVDSTKTWLDKSWRAEKTETGISAIDEIIKEFDLVLKKFREYAHVSDKVVAEMRADRPLNVYALSKLFDEVTEIAEAVPDVVLTGGRDIEAQVKETGLVFDVTVGSGDCPSGCINKINHRFKISPDGNIEVIE
jgi:hypothetical protein